MVEVHDDDAASPDFLQRRRHRIRQLLKNGSLTEHWRAALARHGGEQGSCRGVRIAGVGYENSGCAVREGTEEFADHVHEHRIVVTSNHVSGGGNGDGT